jgi:hypothetical protein
MRGGGLSELRVKAQTPAAQTDALVKKLAF